VEIPAMPVGVPVHVKVTPRREVIFGYQLMIAPKCAGSGDGKPSRSLKEIFNVELREVRCGKSFQGTPQAGELYYRHLSCSNISRLPPYGLNVSVAAGKLFKSSSSKRHITALWELRLKTGKRNEPPNNKLPLGWFDNARPAYLSRTASQRRIKVAFGSTDRILALKKLWDWRGSARIGNPEKPSQ
jgi:hypothetical protein